MREAVALSRFEENEEPEISPSRVGRQGLACAEDVRKPGPRACLKRRSVGRLRLPEADILSGSESRYRLLATAFGSTQGRKAQFLLPFFCASKKGSRHKGETKRKDNLHRRTRSAVIFPRYIILAFARFFVSFMEAPSRTKNPNEPSRVGRQGLACAEDVRKPGPRACLKR